VSFIHDKIQGVIWQTLTNTRNAMNRAPTYHERHLTYKGMEIFTAHGDYVAKRLNEGHDYGIDRETANKAVKIYRA
jgi:hypothetical protein